MRNSKTAVLDKPVFFSSIVLILAVAVVTWIFPQQASQITLKLRLAVLENFGFVYTWMGIIVLGICLYFSFSRYGKVKFGNLDEKPEFRTFTWAASLFTAGIASSILFWSSAEWAYYYSDAPLFIESFTAQAAEYSMAYGLFHWTIIPWAFNVVCALPIGYSYFVRKRPILKISEVCREILGDRVDGWLGKAIDIFFLISITMGITTDCGTGVPVVTGALSSLFGVNLGLWGNRLVMFIITALFTTTCLLGLKKGMAKLSEINTVLALALLAVILLFGPTMFIIKLTTTGIGLMAQNFIRMLTWMAPTSGSTFPQDWTQFYWAWWLSCGPLWGMFIARISRGRSIKNVYLGSILFGSLGCASFFAVMTAYQMNLHLTGVMDFVSPVLSGVGPGAIAIVEGISHLPKFISVLCILLIAFNGICFASSSMDSMTWCFAATSMKHIKASEQPRKWIIVMWAFIIMLIPMGFFGLDKLLQALQSATIVASIPTCLIIILEIASFVRMVKNDHYFEFILEGEPENIEKLRAKYNTDGEEDELQESPGDKKLEVLRLKRSLHNFSRRVL